MQEKCHTGHCIEYLRHEEHGLRMSPWKIIQYALHQPVLQSGNEADLTLAVTSHDRQQENRNNGPDMPHQSRLDHALRQLLIEHRVAALGTVGSDDAALVSMVPFAIEPQAPALVIHVSALAAHTGNMARSPQVSMLVMQAEVAGEPVHALPRVTLRGRAEAPTRGSDAWLAARDAYLARFPDAQPMLQLGDFQLVLIRLDQARHVAGFGAARTVDGDALAMTLAQVADEVARLSRSRALVLSTSNQEDEARNLADRLGPKAAGVFAGAVMHTLGDALQALGAVKNRIHRCHHRQQRLRRADVRRRLFAADVLLARLHGEPVGLVAARID